MNGQGKRIIVVLGMHRSGTSAIARGLKALGVELGERLMPPIAENNEKGFWEDVDANNLDNDLLKHLGHSWDSLGPIDRSVFLRDDLEGFRQRAVDLLREKLAGVTVFGMKDPRISRLLPFWQAAFEQVGATVGYVISARHPLSVARSLNRRDRMDAETSYFLWLDHVAACVRDSKGAPRVVVDYDLLMARPEEQLRRVANVLELPFDPASDDLKTYAREFLAEDLRHSSFGMEDLNLMSDILGQLLEGYRFLHRMARDEVSPDAPEVAAGFDAIIHRLGEIRPDFVRISRKKVDSVRDMHIAHLEQEVRVRDGHITNLQAIIAEREARAAHFEQEVRVRDGHITNLQKAAAEHEAQRAAHVAQLEGEIAIRDGHITNLQKAAAEREALVATREGELSQARQALAEREARVAFLEREAERESELGRLRLADALRQVSRDEDRISRLKASLMELQDLLARREAEIRAREAVIAERQAEVERLDGVLGQVGHRLVSRIGALLAPYPGLRSVIRAPLRALQSLAGKS